MGKPTVDEIAEAIYAEIDLDDSMWLVSERAARSVLALLGRKAGEADDDTVDCETCGGPRPRCAAVYRRGVRCDKPAGDRHSYHVGNSCGWPDGKPDPAPMATCDDCDGTGSTCLESHCYAYDHACKPCLGTGSRPRKDG